MKILVLAGGDSNEREVSLTSGAAVCEALVRMGHDVKALDPGTGRSLLDTDCHWLVGGGPVQNAVAEPTSNHLGSFVNTLATDHTDIDVVFIALHGGAGENGSIQNLLDLAGIKYTGSGMVASAVAMNKALTKRVMAAVQIDTPDWRIYRVGDSFDPEQEAAEIAAVFAPPLIVKPNDGGSTIGLTKVDSEAELPEALEGAATESPDILIEKYVAGRELTVSVFDRRAYPIVEIKAESGLYDYEAKYTKGKSEYIAPAKVESKLASRMQAAAVRIYDAIGCAGLARVDFILDENRRFYCLEVNTSPGMTALSLAPMALTCEDITFDKLVDMMLESALNR